MISTWQKIERHRRFWDMDSTDRPLIGFTIGDYFPSRRYQAAQKVMAKKRLVIWGEFDDDEIALLLDPLPAQGLMLHLVATKYKCGAGSNGNNSYLKRILTAMFFVELPLQANNSHPKTPARGGGW